MAKCLSIFYKITFCCDDNNKNKNNHKWIRHEKRTINLFINKKDFTYLIECLSWYLFSVIIYLSGLYLSPSIHFIVIIILIVLIVINILLIIFK